MIFNQLRCDLARINCKYNSVKSHACSIDSGIDNCIYACRSISNDNLGCGIVVVKT